MAGQRTRRRIPEATVARLPVYLRILSEQFEADVTKISSEELAELAGVNAAKVRKDLSYLGSYGTRGVGYEVEFLVYQIRRELGLTHDWPVVIVGAGNMGQALAGYNGFGDRGFHGRWDRRYRRRQGRGGRRRRPGATRVRTHAESWQRGTSRSASSPPRARRARRSGCVGRCGCHEHFELRSDSDQCAARHQRRQGRPRRRAADPGVSRTTSD